MNIALIILIVFVILVIAFVVKSSVKKRDDGVKKECVSGRDKDRKACEGLITKEGVKDSYKDCINDKYTFSCITECKDKNSVYDPEQDKCVKSCKENIKGNCGVWSTEKSGVKDAYIKCGTGGLFVKNPDLADGCTVECTNPKAVPTILEDESRVCVECDSNDEKSCEIWKGKPGVKNAYKKCEKGRFVSSLLSDGCTVECDSDVSYPDSLSNSCVSLNKQISCNQSVNISSNIAFINYFENKNEKKYLIGYNNSSLLFTSGEDNILAPADWASLDSAIIGSLPDRDLALPSLILKSTNPVVGYYRRGNGDVYYIAGSQVNKLENPTRILDLKSYYDGKTFYIIALNADNKLFIYTDEIPLNLKLIASYDLPSNIRKIIPINTSSFYIITGVDSKLIKLFNNGVITDVNMSVGGTSQFTLDDLTFNYSPSSKRFIFSGVANLVPPPFFSGTYNRIQILTNKYVAPENILIRTEDGVNATITIPGFFDPATPIVEPMSFWEGDLGVQFQYFYSLVGTTGVGFGYKAGLPVLVYMVIGDEYIGIYSRKETPNSVIKLCST